MHMDTNQPILEELSFQIKKLRHLMILAAAIYGFGSEEVLGYSQELDKLIIEYQLQTSWLFIEPEKFLAFLRVYPT